MLSAGEERYMSIVNPDAPWCPDNLEFIRRINGLEKAADVKDIVFDASYLVMGLGDVYLGAPVAPDGSDSSTRHHQVQSREDMDRAKQCRNRRGLHASMEWGVWRYCISRTMPVWRDKGFRTNEDSVGS